MQELSDRVNAALESCRDLPQGSRPLLVSHGIALGCPGEYDSRITSMGRAPLTSA